jgi:hypothetical protein
MKPRLQHHAVNKKGQRVGQKNKWLKTQGSRLIQELEFNSFFPPSSSHLTLLAYHGRTELEGYAETYPSAKKKPILSQYVNLPEVFCYPPRGALAIA